MRCPDDSDQSGKASDPDTRQLCFDAPKQNQNANAYRTVRNADPDADAGSVVRCCAVPHLTTVPVRGRTRGSGPRSRIRVSILKPGTTSFLKLNCKKYERIHLKVGADPVFFQKIMIKIFLKLLGVTRTRIRILGSGSIRNSSKMQNANDSRSGRGQDHRIIPN
jgi:hypothetical protein